jgi:hypothetical protein
LTIELLAWSRRRVGRNSNYPREAWADGDIFEVTAKEHLQGRRTKMLDMLGIVTQAPDIFASAKVAQSKEWLPWDRYDAMPTTNASQLFNGSFRRVEML